MAQRKTRTPATTKNVKRNSYRMLDDKEVRPVKYFGKHAGHGTFMAGTVDGELVVDSAGRPKPYKTI
jgi:hypothetical protein